MSAELSPAALARYVQWQANTRLRGAVPTRKPSEPNKGDLAERHGSRSPYSYALAPAQIRADDRGVAIGIILDKAKGQAANVITGTVSAVKGAAQAVAAAPRNAASAALGLPKWAITAMALAGIAFVVYRVVTAQKLSR